MDSVFSFSPINVGISTFFCNSFVRFTPPEMRGCYFRWVKCKNKLEILLEQKADLCFSLNALIQEIGEGKTRMKTYRQMKMYNDPATNPELYNKN